MKFLSIFKTVEQHVSQEEMAKMGKLVEEGLKAGYMLGTGEKVVVTDGPFIESKEVVGGFALLQANSKAEAIELTKQFLAVAGDGECELRQLYEAGTGAEHAAKA